jgi:hypothetical protein
MDNTAQAIFSVLFVILIFVLLRELVMWYWKINLIVKNQEKTNLMIKKYMEAKGIEFSDDEKAKLKS